jgi:prepilin-type N-terminal cleavage/methylation domain-containing protein
MSMKPSRKKQSGFTLIEMTLALALSLGISATVVAILRQQISFTQIIANFQFLREEAPQVNSLLATILQEADSYRIYGTRANAMSATSAVQTGGRALRLRFRNPDGTADFAVIAFESINGVSRLNYYYRAANETSWPTDPRWVISSRPALVDFANDTGILLITMTGPNGEQITYAGNPEG